MVGGGIVCEHMARASLSVAELRSEGVVGVRDFAECPNKRKKGGVELVGGQWAGTQCESFHPLEDLTNYAQRTTGRDG